LLHKQLDQEGAAMLQEGIERLGIGVVVEAATEAILGNNSVSAVRLQGGQTLPASLVLCSTGVRPNAGLARAAGLAVKTGIVVDDQMRTSADDVYAAGDVAEYEGQLPCIIPVAVQQARVAAANMVQPGSAAYIGAVPFTTLKIVGIDLASIGLVAPPAEGYEELMRVDQDSGVYRKLVLRDGRIVGAILLGDKKQVAPVRKLIEQGADVSAYGDRLLDDDFELQAIT
jgi:nitrite reductase (NADH) large subunit